jgi:hypothetical protein
MFDSFRVAREQALNYSELVSGKRGLFGSSAKLGEEKLAGSASKGWGQKAKNFLLSLVVGGVAASAGTDIYGKINPNSQALGATGGPDSTSTSANTGDSTTDPNTGYTSTVPTTNPGYATNGGPSNYGYATNGGPSNYGYTTGPDSTSENGSIAQVNTVPTIGTQTTATRAIASEERAPDSKLPVKISSESSIPSHV